jgi:hypothetical protein
MPEEVREAYLEVKDAATKEVVTAVEILFYLRNSTLHSLASFGELGCWHEVFESPDRLCPQSIQ